MAENIKIKTEVQGDVLIVSMSGRMDAVAAPEAEARVGSLVDEGGDKVLLEWAGVEYLSSAGIRMLLAISKKLKSKQGKLVLCNITENVKDVLKMSGFDHVLTVAANRDAGLVALGRK